MKKYSDKDKGKLAQAFKALGHPRRIAIFLALQKSGASGINYAGLAKAANMAEPSLAHHIQMMRKGGIVLAKSKGSFTIFTLNPVWSEQIQAFLYK